MEYIRNTMTLDRKCPLPYTPTTGGKCDNKPLSRDGVLLLLSKSC